MVLCLVGVVLFGTAAWASVEVGKSADNRAIQQTIEDGNAKAVAATEASNRQLADQLQRSTKQLQDNQDRALADIQKHVLAIRTAVAERPAPALQFPADTNAPAATPKRQPPKTR
jgi:small-conductance mechanosensitive channel